MYNQSEVDGVFEAAKEAGRQIVKEGKISDDVLKNISGELISQEVYYKAAMEQLNRCRSQ